MVIERVGSEALPHLQRYLDRHTIENVILLHDLLHQDPLRPAVDRLRLSGLRLEGRIIAVQGLYASGRWFPHFCHDAAVDPLVEDARRLDVRWVMGADRVVQPILERLLQSGARPTYDERDYVYHVDQQRLRPIRGWGIRRAEEDDVSAIAHLRKLFDVEYFGSDPQQISDAWCHRIASEYVRYGTYIAEREGQIVAMAATEASLPQLAQIGAVLTLRRYRNRGLAKQVVSAICEDKLRRHPQVILTVRKDNAPALAAYGALGFSYRGDYAMTRLR